MRRASVLFVGHTAECGGGEIALLNLIANLDQEKIEPSVLLFAHGPLESRLQEYVPVMVSPLNGGVLTAHRDALGSTARWRDVIRMFGFIGRLSRTIAGMRVDMVHTNSLKADLIGGVAARLVGVPVVWHVRDRIAGDYLPARVAKLFRLLARLIPGRVIANSQATLETLLEAPDGSAPIGRLESKFRSRAFVVHDGVQVSEAEPKQPVRDHVVVGLVGRISPWKGQDVFLRAAAKIRSTDATVVFRIIGSPLFGEEIYAASVRKLCGDLGLESCVEFTGFISNVAEAIGDLDIVVHASTLAEPFGQVIIEGMAAGKPVVATHGGGVPEIVVEGVTGFLVPMKDDEAMAAAIAKLIENPEMRCRMGRSGRERVKEKFRIEMTAEKVQHVFESVLSSSNRGAKQSALQKLRKSSKNAEDKSAQMS